MLNLVDAAADVLAVRLDRPLEQHDLESWLELLEDRLQRRETTGLYLEVPEPAGLCLSPFSGLALRAMALVPRLGGFKRIALVTANPWLRCWLKLASPVLPTSRIEAFEPRERALALAWARGEQDRQQGASLAIVETGSPHVLGVEVDGRVQAREMRALADRLNAALADRRPLRLLSRVARIDGFDAPDCLLTSDFLRLRRLAGPAGTLGNRRPGRPARMGETDEPDASRPCAVFQAGAGAAGLGLARCAAASRAPAPGVLTGGGRSSVRPLAQSP